jgi:HK97 family phage prohead protease
MTKVVRKFLSVLVKLVAPGVFDAVFSSSNVDRENDRIFATGWKLPKNRELPLLWQHNHEDLPLGKVSDLRVEGQQLVGRVTYPPRGLHPFADQVSDLMAAGFISTFSVGCLELEEPTRNQFGGYDITSAELLEVSVVTIPANADAKLRAMQKALTDLRAAVESDDERASDDGTFDMDEAAFDRALREGDDDRLEMDEDELDRTIRDGVGRAIDSAIAAHLGRIDDGDDPTPAALGGLHADDTIEASEDDITRAVADVITEEINKHLGRVD